VRKKGDKLLAVFDVLDVRRGVRLGGADSGSVFPYKERWVGGWSSPLIGVVDQQEEEEANPSSKTEKEGKPQSSLPLR